MNYRHAFHAGNFADCMKHAMLVAILGHLRRKEAGFCVLDTHAGAGATLLAGPEATRTGEWRQGIGRLLDDTPPALAPYVAAARAAGLDRGVYPGSPLLVASLLRAQDRLIACELHPDDAQALRRTLAGMPGAGVHHRDGYDAIGALLPPRVEKRGLVLIDPPFESTSEFETLAAAVARARARFANATIAAWYPIKGRQPARRFHDALAHAGVADVVAYELWLRTPLDPARLNGCGMVIANGPHALEQATGEHACGPMLAALSVRLGDRGEGGDRVEVGDRGEEGDAGAGWRVVRLTAEKLP